MERVAPSKLKYYLMFLSASDCFVHPAFLDCRTAWLEQLALGNNNKFTFYNASLKHIRKYLKYKTFQ